MDFAGPTGLDYNALSHVADWMDIQIDESVFRKIKVLETDYLSQFYGDKNSPKVRPCRHPAMCSMCRKKCSDRVTIQ